MWTRQGKSAGTERLGIELLGSLAGNAENRQLECVNTLLSSTSMGTF